MELISKGRQASTGALLDEIHAQIERELTLDRIDGLSNAILAGYRQRKAVVDQFAHPGIGEQLWPQHRRAAVLAALFKLPERLPELGIVTKVERASRGNDRFVDIRLGGLRLVACGVTRRYHLPRSAESRKTRAQSGQQSILALLEQKQDSVDATPLDDAIFGLLLHSPAKQDHERFGFFDLVIPDGDYYRTIVRRDLIQMAAALREVEARPVQARKLRLKAPARSQEAQ